MRRLIPLAVAACRLIYCTPRQRLLMRLTDLIGGAVSRFGVEVAHPGADFFWIHQNSIACHFSSVSGAKKFPAGVIADRLFFIERSCGRGQAYLDRLGRIA